MKIIITEKQLEALKLLKESDDRINSYVNNLNNITKELNKAYSKLSYITIAELLSGESDIDPISVMVNSLEVKNSKISDEFNRFFKSFDEDTYYNMWEKTHDALEKLYYKNIDKINVLLTIISNLGNLVYDNEDNKSVFSDIESINIG